jgi:hypothetical protein
LFGGDAPDPREGRIIESHHQQVDKKILTVGRFAVCEHHQLKSLVLISEFGCSFKSQEQDLKMFYCEDLDSVLAIDSVEYNIRQRGE